MKPVLDRPWCRLEPQLLVGWGLTTLQHKKRRDCNPGIPILPMPKSWDWTRNSGIFGIGKYRIP